MAAPATILKESVVLRNRKGTGRPGMGHFFFRYASAAAPPAINTISQSKLEVKFCNSQSGIVSPHAGSLRQNCTIFLDFSFPSLLCLVMLGAKLHTMASSDQLGFSFRPLERRIWTVRDLVSTVRTHIEREYGDV
ncbi:MAG: hypothetical protein DMG96_20500, partial [Acidobacteria bacterium]